MPIFYEIDSTRVSLREYLWGTKNPLLLVIGMLLKLFRVRIPSSSDDPNIDSTLGCVVEKLPPDIESRFAPMTAELASLGFFDPVFHVIEDLGTQTRIYWTTFRHTSDQHCARIHHRNWGKAQKHDRGLFAIFFTPFTDGTFLLSSSGKPDVAAPQAIQMNRMPGATVSKLWAKHEQLATACSLHKAVERVTYRGEIIAASERLHLLQRDFHLARGFFRQRTAEELTKTELFSAAVEQARTNGIEYPEAMAELTRLQEQKPKWTSGIWVLVVSAVAFLAAGSAQWNWKTTLWLIPILLFHEFGHWITMRLFHYRNLRMFFIPFFGAAVTGQNWNVPGWKKALVSLAGPLPGIAVGITLGMVGIIGKIAVLKQAALMLILINGFNLLPVLPLDGGHFLHSTLFCRNRWLDITFRTVAVVALISLSVFFGLGKFLLYIGIVLGIGLPVAFKMGKITDRLRQEPFPPPLPGEDRIPVTTAQTLIGAVKSELPKNASNKILAQHALNIFETLNARPPGAWATSGLLVLYGGALGMSIICVMLLLIAKEGDLGRFMRAAAGQPRHKVECNTSQAWQGSAFDEAASRNLIVTTFKKRAAAQSGFDELKARLPSTAAATLFGDSLLLSLPTADDPSREKWFDELQRHSTNTFVAISNSSVSVSLTFLAPTATAATNIEQELEDYLASASTMNLIPPWDPKAASAEFVAQRKARAAWREITQRANDHWQNTNLSSYSVKIAAAQRRGALDEVNRLGKEQKDRALQLQAEARKQLQIKYASTPFAALVDLEAELSSVPFTNRIARASVLTRIAAHLGARENAGRATFGFGTVTRNGLLMEAPWLSVAKPESNLPQLLDWLCQRSCNQIRYTFYNSGSYSEDDLEEQ